MRQSPPPFVRAMMGAPMPDNIEAIAAGLVNLIPARTKALILASSAEWQRAGTIAKRAGMTGGFAAVPIFKAAGFHEQYWPEGSQQMLWRLNGLGLRVRQYLEEQGS